MHPDLRFAQVVNAIDHEVMAVDGNFFYAEDDVVSECLDNLLEGK